VVGRTPPVDLVRRLLIEAGHRCAIPTCRAIGPLEIEHIEDWAKVRRHDFENMIVLCANCHGRKGNRRGEIDGKSLRQYKAKLALLNSSYSDVERRMLETFAQQFALLRPSLARSFGDKLSADWRRGFAIPLPGTLRLMMSYLVKDGYVELAPTGTRFVSFLGESQTILLMAMPPLDGVIPDVDYWRLTSAGVAFVDEWLGTQDSEPSGSSDPL
jgi:hypothetical protein